LPQGVPSSTVGQTGQPPDLASMTPQQAADRLFNRIMTASENGNTEEALRFVPMAVAAYGNLATMDNDARYHLALIHLVASDVKNARAQLDELRRSAPMHLLGYLLEYQIAEKNGDQQGITRASRDFLDAYEAEFFMDRHEYRDHQGSIDSFRKAAQASLAGKQ
jgi:hypothetical protein